MTPQELQAEARANLSKAAEKLRARFSAGDIHEKKWEMVANGEQTKVGKGTLKIWSRTPGSGYPGHSYTSSQGPNADNSYSGFLPETTFEEAKLLVYGDYLKQTR